MRKRHWMWGSFLLLGIILLAALRPAPTLAAPTPGSEDPAMMAAPAPSGCVYHTVRRGDTLAVIAYHYNTTVWNLASLNGLRSLDWIYPGQNLLIYPCSGQPDYYIPAPPPVYHPPAPAPAPPTDPYAYCHIQPVLGFGRVWYTNATVRKSLGCPTGAETPLAVTAQRYKGGWFWFNQSLGRWEILHTNNGWSLFHDEYAARHAAGTLGVALTGPFASHGTYQLYEGGGMVWTPATGLVVFFNNGTWRGY